MDISPAAVEAATAHAAALGLAGRARYQVGMFAQTGLGTASVDAVVSVDALLLSVDALLFAPDKEAACVEPARVLRPAAGWPRRPGTTTAHPSGARRGSTTTGPCCTGPGSTSVDELAAEAGEDPATVRASVEEMGRTQDAMIRRY